MSEPKLISPLLDNFIMGDPISDHNGIRCCPAMNQQTNDKYIVKIISLPASATQLDAMLLTGALKDEADALAYYEARANDIVKDIKVLNALAHQEGFLPYAGYQVVPMEDRIGFDIYILTEYRRTLARQMEKHPLTHLDALNLGLDMCSALAACRRSGYIFTNLKPTNIFITENGEYKISDSGFVGINVLNYATLPEHHIGPFTAPEVTDTFAALNTSMDVYSIGMILYMIFNGGILPPADAESIEQPAYADAELSEIIMKACSIHMESRWSDPAQMGQALVTYMQKNGASDLPIVPIHVEEINEADVTDESDIAETESISQEAEHLVENPNLAAEESSITDVDLSELEEISADESEEEDITDESDDTILIPSTQVEDEAVYEESAEAETTEDVAYDELSDEVSQMLAQADELAAAEVPDPVVAPDAVVITLPTEDAAASGEPVSQDTIAEIDGIKALLDEDAEDMPEDVPVVQQREPVYDDEEDDEEYAPAKSHVLRNLLIILGILAVLIAGFLFYKLYVLQTITDMQLTGSKDQLTVRLLTETDDSKLTVTCSDSYGHVITVPVVNGEASFSGLSADEEYAITVNISGLHILNGKTYKNYFTDSKTEIVQCDVINGTVEGSAILNFVVEGPDSGNWIFTYIAPNGDTNSITFSGHAVTITDLLVNQEYNGILAPEDDIFLEENYQITFTPTAIIQAQDLIITGCTNNTLTAQWSAPADTTVASWSVRCYNDSGYDKTVTVDQCAVSFDEIDCSKEYTVEVIALGQSVSQKTTIGANSVTVQNLIADTSKAGIITATWEASSIPASGWIVSFALSNSELVFEVEANENTATLSPAVPGAEYTITVRAADDTATACAPVQSTTDKAADFQVNYHGNLVTRRNLHFSMCVRPNKTDWERNDVKTYTTRFKNGQKASFVIFLDRKYDVSADPITISFVICDANGQYISVDSTTIVWSNMWFKNYCELDIPSIPTESGNYTMYVYFNGQFAEKQSFSVV